MIAPHHLGPWDFEPTREEGCAFAIYPATTSEPLAYVAARDGAEEIARLMAAAPKLRDENRELRDALRELMDFCESVCVARRLDGSEVAVTPVFQQARDALASTTAKPAEGFEEGRPYV